MPTGEQLPPDPHLLFAAAVALAEQDRTQRRSRPASRSPGATWSPSRSAPCSLSATRSTSSSGTAGATATPRDDADVRVVSAAPDGVTIEVDRISTRSTSRSAESSPTGSSRTSTSTARMGVAHLRAVPRFVDPADVVAQGSLLAPMPGTVIGVPLEAGAEVTAGQTVLVLEAMKMQHTISAPTDGVLSELAVAMGQQVSAGEVLAVVTARQTERRVRPDSDQKETSHEQLHRVRGAPDPAQGGRPSSPATTAGSTSPAARATARRPPTCGSRSARRATSASTSPRSTAAVAAGSVTSRRSARSSPPRAARC